MSDALPHWRCLGQDLSYVQFSEVFNESSVGIEITLLFGHGVKPGRVAIISEV